MFTLATIQTNLEPLHGVRKELFTFDGTNYEKKKNLTDKKKEQLRDLPVPARPGGEPFRHCEYIEMK